MLDSKVRKVPTLRARWLGQELRDLREQKGLTLRQVAGYLKRNFSALSRFENAEWPIPRQDVQLLLDLYGVAEKRERARLTRLSEEVWRKDDWISEYNDALYDPSFSEVPWLEQRAKRIASFDGMYLLGLLQTRGYATAMIGAMESAATQDQIARWVELRLRRQRVLEGQRPTRISAIVPESVLRTPVGGAEVMSGQLNHLCRLTRKRHIEVRVLPAGTGAHAGMDGPFLLFEMDDPFPEVAYVENLGGRAFLTAPKTKPFVDAYDRLRAAALDPDESTKLIMSIAEELDD